MKNTDLQSLKKRVSEDPGFNEEYQKLNLEFMVIDVLLSMRKSAGLTQRQIAMHMGTKETNISRLEKGRSNPTLKTLEGYAKACGFELKIDYRPLSN
ncbi:helix-turn-helix domain-containing protein [Shewanella holmiensis]|uniref:Helix-turn-helix domain-containing protein n=1 Tax=Shewanella holmiensis TaxID=2952222 RepID=A0A9X2WR77_9GAMM|nr:helix-turn-helix domain-containing protein [Shewanella holmiensis]